VPGVSIRAEKTFSPDEEFFRDHFPGFPVVPGVLLTEVMAQAAGKCLNAEGGSRGKAMLTQIKSATFRHWVRPGEKADVFSEIRANQDQFSTARCRIELGGEPVCSAELLFAFLPSEQFAPDYRDEVLENFLKARRTS